MKRKLKREAKRKGNAKAEIDPSLLENKELPGSFTWNLTMSKTDMCRLSKNFAFMARTLKQKTTDEGVLMSGKAALEHHFDNHECCGAWCQQKCNLNDPAKHCRCKTKDWQLCERLQSIVARFNTLGALKEVGHDLDTCANESFNNTVSWLVPKTKVCFGSELLINRVCIAMGVCALGLEECCVGLLTRIGVTVTKDIRHHLHSKDATGTLRTQNTKTRQFKVKRKAAEHARLQQETQEAKIARDKQDGTCESGIRMTGAHTDLDTEPPARKRAPVCASEPNKKGDEPMCSSCEKPGHWRPTNKSCENCTPRNSKQKGVTATPAATAPSEAQDMAAETDVLDAMPLDDDQSDESDAFCSAASEFSWTAAKSQLWHGLPKQLRCHF